MEPFQRTSTPQFSPLNCIIHSVWRARDINKNDPKHQQQQQGYAIKIIPKEQAEFCPTYNIKKEVLIHENLAHPNIIKLFEARKDNSNYYLVMELSVGGELFEKIGTHLWIVAI